MPADTETYYTLRRQRPGYIYIFHEKYQKWTAYKILDPNLFSTLDLPVPACYMKFTSFGILMVESDDPIWLCFTNHPLSQKVLENAGGNKHIREAHMRFFDPKNWKGKPHTAPLEETIKQVADFAPGIREVAFWHSFTEFKKCSISLVKQLALPLPPPPERSDSLTYTTMGSDGETYLPTQEEWDRGAIVALDDPAGIVMDIRATMASLIDKFMTEPQRARRIASHNAISALQSIVESNAEIQLWEDTALARDAALIGSQSKRNQLEWARRNEVGVRRFPTEDEIRESNRVKNEKLEIYDRLYKATEAKVPGVRTAAWNDYKDCIDKTAFDNWSAKLDAEFKEYDDKHIYPLAEAHAQWMRSPELYKVFRYHYHSSGKDKNGQYMELMRLCIEGTQRWKPCMDLYLEWMETNKIAPNNILFRAFLNNDHDLITEANKLSGFTNDLDFNAATKNAVSTIKKIVDALGKGVAEQNKAFLAETLGTFNELVGRTLEDTPKGGGRLALGLLAATENKVYVVKTFEGTTKAFKAVVKESLMAANPEMTEKTARSFAKEALQAKGIKTFQETPFKFKWAFLEDLEEAGQAANKGTASKAIQSISQLENSTVGFWRTFKAVGGGWRMAGLILQGASLWKNIGKVSKADPDKKWEERVRLLSAIASTAGAISYVMYDALRPAVVLGLKQSACFSAFKLGSVAGAIINGLVDVWKGTEAFIKKDFYLFSLYSISAVSGVLAGIILSTSWLASYAWAVPWVGWAALAVYIAVNYGISTYRKLKIRDWLKHSAFGIYAAPDGDKVSFEEMKGFKTALGVA